MMRKMDTLQVTGFQRTHEHCITPRGTAVGFKSRGLANQFLRRTIPSRQDWECRFHG